MAKKSSVSSPRGKRQEEKEKDTLNLTADTRRDLDTLEAQSEDAIDTSDPDAPDRSGQPG